MSIACSLKSAVLPSFEKEWQEPYLFRLRCSFTVVALLERFREFTFILDEADSLYCLLVLWCVDEQRHCSRIFYACISLRKRVQQVYSYCHVIDSGKLLSLFYIQKACS